MMYYTLCLAIVMTGCADYKWCVGGVTYESKFCIKFDWKCKDKKCRMKVRKAW